MAKKDREFKWRFFRAGGFDQVRLDSGRDLLALEQLDQKLWVALACPVDNVVFDPRTLSLIDSDNDKRIRAVDLIAAVKWAASLLNNPDDLVKCSETLAVDAINTSGDQGAKIASAARKCLAALGRNETDGIKVSDTESLEKIIWQRNYNGDGIITVDSAESDSVLRDVISTIITVCGGVTDRSGKPGINKEKIDQFISLLKEYNVWISESEGTEKLHPLGDRTIKAVDAVIAVREKIDDYFARCAIADYDERAANLLNADEQGIGIIGKGVLTHLTNEIGTLPLALITPVAELSLCKKLNPYWAEKMGVFYNDAVIPIVGDVDKITENDWRKILQTLEPVLEWRKRKPLSAVDTIDIKTIREMLDENKYVKLCKLIELDCTESETINALIDLEKLTRFHRDIYKLCTNFVNFKHFYSNGDPAIFQAGVLYLDQRSCELCIKVDDINKHSAMAAMAGTYLAYCECRRKGGAEKFNIVAAFTNGDSDNLMAGRNGIFYDRNGLDWDATVVKIIENPISLRQAFWLPYKNLVKMIETQVAKRASAADAAANDKMVKTAAVTANADKAKIEAVPPKKLDIGVVAAIGVAAGALGTFAATICGYLMGIVKLGPFAIIAAMIGILLLISGPSLILAYIKLRKRNLGPILDAGGWAINAKAKINVPFGNILTKVSSLPAGSQRDLHDPYAEKKSPWPKIIIFAILLYIAFVVLDNLGFIRDWTDGRIGKKKASSESTFIKK